MAGILEKNKLTSPNAAKPSQLDTASDSGSVDDALAELSQLNVSAPKINAVSNDVNAALSELPTDQIQQATVTAPPEQPLAPPDQMATQDNSIPGLINQIRELPTRMKLSFGVTPKEKADWLSKKLGADNVRSSGDKVIYKFPNEKKWRSIDNKSFELITDTIGDFARDIFEGGVDLAARVPTIMTGPVGGAGAAVTSLAAGDKAAEALGFEKDPARSSAIEYTLAGATGAILPVIGGAITRRAAAKEAQKLMTANVARGAAREAVDAINQLAQTKLGKEMAVRDINLMAHQLVKPGIAPEATEIAKAASQNDIFRNRVIEQGEILSKGYHAALDYMGNVMGVKPGLTKDLAEEAIKESRFEGKLIGGWRDLAKKQGGNELQQMPNASKILLGEYLPALESITKNHKIDKLTYNSVGKLDKEAIQDLRTQFFPGMKTTDIKTVLQSITTVTDQLNNKNNIGAMTFEQMDNQYKILTNAIDSAKPRSQLQMNLIKIKNALRDDWTNSIGNLLGPESKAAYQQSLDRYSTIQKAHKELSSAFKNNSMSSEALMSYLFDSKAKNTGRVTAVKNLISDSDPELWLQIKSQYMDKLKNEFTRGIEAPNSQVTEFIDWNGFGKKINGLGTEVVDDLLEGSGIDRTTLDNLITVGKQFQNTSFENMKKPEKIGALRRLLLTFTANISSDYHKANESMKFISKMGEDASVIRYINSGAADDIINQVIKADRRDVVKEMFRTVADALPQPIVKPTRKVLETGIRVKSRKDLSNAATESRSE